MKAIHVLPKALNYLATALNADKVQRLFDFGAKEDVLRALFIENSAEYTILNHEEIYQIFEAIRRETSVGFNIQSTGLNYTARNKGIVSLVYALVDDFENTLSNHSSYVTGLIEFETKLDYDTKKIDLTNVISHSCELNVYYQDEAKYLTHQELTIFKNNTPYYNPYFDGARMHATIMHALQNSLHELRAHLYT